MPATSALDGPPRVLVIGCGPSGLLAAHAAAQRGFGVQIVAPKQKSQMGGAMFLHEPIPDLNDPEEPTGYIRLLKVGDPEVYAKKVYGRRNAKVSWNLWDEGLIPAWSMAATYHHLWGKYHDLIEDASVSGSEIAGLVADFDAVISTAPLYKLCENSRHEFRSASVILTARGACDLRNTIVYNGQETEGWYRTSNIFGYEWTEYPMECESAPIADARVGRKPTSNTCTCHPGLIRVGRFGRWERDVLAHHAYKEARDALLKL